MRESLIDLSLISRIYANIRRTNDRESGETIGREGEESEEWLHARQRKKHSIRPRARKKKNGKSIDEIDPFCAIWMTRNVIVIIR